MFPMKKFHDILRIRLLPIIELVFSAAYRVLPNAIKPPNLAPVGGFAIYSGARLPFWQALLFPFITMAISDLALQQMLGYPMFNRFVYASFVIYSLLGRWLLRNSKSWPRIVGVTALGSLQFYLITNFGVWFSELGQANAMYAPTLAGLATCYVKGLPFLAYTMESDLLFCLSFFALHEWAAQLSPSTARVLVPQEGVA